MARFIAALIAAVLAVAPPTTGAALDRPIAQADYAWLIFVDDLHLNFANTGRLRTLLRTIATVLVRDGDLIELRTTGPSAAAIPLTADRELFAAAVKTATGNGLKPGDFLGTAPGSPAWNEVLYRANTSLETARDALSTFSLVTASARRSCYVSAGYDVDGSRPSPIASRLSAAGPAKTTSRSSQSTLAVSWASRSTRRVDASASLRYTTAARRSLAMMAEETGGFVIEDGNEPAAGLQRINLQMR